LDIAAHLSIAAPWPDGSGNAPLGKSLIISAEDTLADTIAPRLDDLGADTSQIIHLDVEVRELKNDKEEERYLSLKMDLADLEQFIVEQNIIHVIIDPLLAFTGDIDTHKMAETRSILAPIAAMAQRTKCAVTGIMHLNKSSTESNLLYRVNSSLDFVAAARSVMAVVKHPQEKDQFILATLKCNLSAKPEPLAYQFEEGEFTWKGTVDPDLLPDAFRSAKGENAQIEREDATEFLKIMLGDGPQPVTVILKEAKDNQISHRTLERAKKDLGVISYREHKPGGKRGEGIWYWRLSDEDEPVQVDDEPSPKEPPTKKGWEKDLEEILNKDVKDRHSNPKDDGGLKKPEGEEGPSKEDVKDRHVEGYIDGGLKEGEDVFDALSSAPEEPNSLRPPPERLLVGGLKQNGNEEGAGVKDRHVVRVLGGGLKESYERITSLVRLHEVVDLLAAEPVISLDLETYGRPKTLATNPYQGSIRLISLACSQGVWVIDVQDFAEPPVKELIPILQSPGLKLAHNWFFDARFLERATGVFPENLFDTYLASRVLFADDKDNHGLGDVAERMLGITLDKSFQKYDYSKPLTEAHFQYSALDALVPLKLYLILKEEIQQKSLDDILDLEHRILPHFLRMWQKGKNLNWDRWTELINTSAQRKANFEVTLEEELPKYLSLTGIDRLLAGIKTRKPGAPLNWNATEQLKPVLHKLGVAVADCQIETLEAMVNKHPLVSHIVNYRKERSRYDRLVERLKHRGPDDRIHASWKQIGARTGRTSCAEPNLQNVPRDDEIRACYIPGQGNIFLDLDYNQIEPRVLAALCRDERLLEAFRQKLDLYCWIASELLDISIEEIDSDGWERKWGKITLLATMYGQQAQSLAKSMSKAAGRHVSEEEAAEHLIKFHDLFPGVAEWSDRQRALVKRGPYVKSKSGKIYREDYGEATTIRGRKRLVRAYHWKAPMEILNAPVQGSAADAAKETLAVLYETQEESGGAFLSTNR
jgi:DNA polymerase-1